MNIKRNAMMKKAKLKIENLCVELNKNRILENFSLEIGDGEFVSIVGPSGSGKSTLLKTIAGINPIKSGQIELDGIIINDEPAHKRGAVIVFQDMRLFPHMNVNENVTYSLRLKGISKADRIKAAEKYLSYVQLEDLGKRKVSQLSGGQKQRVALARALAAEPELLLLDEPFSALDEELREDMRKLLKKLHRKFKMTTIMVTHDKNEAKRLSDRVINMI